MDELKKIHKLLDSTLYDDLNDYQRGVKDILNYIFDRDNVDDGLLEHFKTIEK